MNNSLLSIGAIAALAVFLWPAYILSRRQLAGGMQALVERNAELRRNGLRVYLIKQAYNPVWLGRDAGSNPYRTYSLVYIEDNRLHAEIVAWNRMIPSEQWAGMPWQAFRSEPTEYSVTVNWPARQARPADLYWVVGVDLAGPQAIAAALHQQLPSIRLGVGRLQSGASLGRPEERRDNSPAANRLRANRDTFMTDIRAAMAAE